MIDEDRSNWTLGQLADEVIEACELPMGCRGTIMAALDDAKDQGRAEFAPYAELSAALLTDARHVLRLADRSEAWRAERDRVVAAIDNAALRIAPGSAGDGVPLKVPQGANGQALSDSREESGKGSNPEAAPFCHETDRESRVAALVAERESTPEGKEAMDRARERLASRLQSGKKSDAPRWVCSEAGCAITDPRHCAHCRERCTNKDAP